MFIYFGSLKINELYYFLFLVYYTACLYLIANATFFKRSNISKKNLFSLFTLKIIAGFAYAYYFSLPSQINTSDTWQYFNESLVETDKLFHQPKLFFSELWYNQYANNSGLFTGIHSFWSDLKATVFVKIIAILNVFSLKNYYINLIFFNLFVFYGCIALYKLVVEYFTVKSWILFLTIFLLPSFLFWCSGLHKDGIIFSCIALILYNFNFLQTQPHSTKRLISIGFYLLIIFLLRNYVLLALIPALAAWYCSTKFKIKPIVVFASTILVCLTLFFCSSNFKTTKSIGGSIVQKHQEFQRLEGKTKIKTPLLENSTKSLISYFPFAIKTVILQPIPSTKNGLGQNLTSFENYFYLLVTFVSLFFISSQKINSPFLLALLTITFFLYLFIGYTVCFGGAIVRYRSIILPFSILPSILLIFGKLKTENQS